MRLVFSRCHGEKPWSGGVSELEELVELFAKEYFINASRKIWWIPIATRSETQP
jgi:hypothetical protein